MSDLKDLIGRKYLFRRDLNGNAIPVKELPSATWLHPDGSAQSVPLDSVASYCDNDIEFVVRSTEKVIHQ